MNYQNVIKDKIIDRTALARTLKAKKLTGQKIVFTNGCFDLLHPGHIRYLAAALDLGDFLVIGLNSDASVSRLKGPHRPMQNQIIRAELMAALHVVGAVVIFDEDTPIELLKVLEPDVLVKGGDYTIETIVGADLILERGGRVEVIPFEDGFSTTNLIEKIKHGEG